MDAATRAQLAVLSELCGILSGAGIAWWLFGGWAVDAHAGRVTRDHSDIEIFVWADDAGALRSALEARGFAAPAPLHPDEGQPFLRDGVEVSCWHLIEDDGGRVVTPGRWADRPWPAGSFGAPPAKIEGLELPVVSLDCLLEMKLRFAERPHGAPLRDKDNADIELLRRLDAGAP